MLDLCWLNVRRARSWRLAILTACVLFLAAPMSQAKPVHASGLTLALSPTTGAVGTTVTASGYASTTGSSLQITIYFGSSLIATAYTNASSGYYSTSFTVPSTASGNVTVTANSATYGYYASTTFYVTGSTAGLTLSPTTGAIGSTVTAYGYATVVTGVSLTISIVFGGTPVAYTTSNASTGYYSASFTVPSTASGTATVTASSATYGYQASATYYVSGSTGGLTLSPTTGAIGTSVTAYGYATIVSGSSLPITIYFGVTYVATAYSNASSGYYSTSFTVPSTASGTVTVIASSTTYGYQASATYYVTGSTGSLTLSPTTGAIGTTITASGYATTVYGTSLPITIFFGGTQVTTAYSNASTGYYSTSFTVPSTASGAVTVIASSTSYGYQASASYYVTGSTASLTLSPTTGPVGTTVTASGYSTTIWHRLPIAIVFGSTQVATAYTNASTGYFSTTLPCRARQAARRR